MCDFSLQSVRSRPAKVGDKLVTRDFGPVRILDVVGVDLIERAVAPTLVVAAGHQPIFRLRSFARRASVTGA